MAKPPPCMHCDQVARKTTGQEVYPRRPDLWEKVIWKCDGCGAYCGCHPGSSTPLGYPANAETRRARMLLHNKMLDPLWKKQRKGRRRYARNMVYAFLSAELGMPGERTHTAMWDVETCRKAWRALQGKTLADIETALEYGQ
ncbi:MAG: zinc-finger-containing protein [Pseudomonadota bacterium]